MIDRAHFELSTSLYQRIGDYTVIVKGAPSLASDMDEFANELRSRFMDQVEQYVEPNACEYCGGRQGLMAAFRLGDQRHFVHPMCYPDLMSTPAMANAELRIT